MLVALVSSLATPASAVTVRIDFEADRGTPAVGWNLVDASDSGATIDLLDITGADSGIDLGMPTVLDNGGAFDGWNDANPLPAWLPLEAADDYVYSTANNTNFRFRGLDPSLTYDITLVVSRDLSRSQDMRWVAGNGDFDVNDWDSQVDGYLAGNVVTWSGIAPTATGDLRLRVRRNDASVAVNALQIRSVAEPAPLALLAMAGLSWGVLRRS